jgi:DNA-3-methyladenine glycosylase II
VGTGTVLAVQAPQILLSEEVFAQATRDLAQRDADLAAVLEKYGPPPLWSAIPASRPSSISSSSSKYLWLLPALYQRLQEVVRPFTPGCFLKLTEDEMRQLGFSRQKARYTRLLADAIQHRQLDLDAPHDLHDDHAREKLIALKGIGQWTADIYLLSALRRPDIWPVGDLALATAVQEVKRLRKLALTRKTRETEPSVASLPRRRRPTFLAQLPLQARPKHNFCQLVGSPTRALRSVA